MNCPICSSESRPVLTREGHSYCECSACSFLFHRKDSHAAPEAPLEFYDERYWEMERGEARRRECEDCFIRALELLYLSSIRVDNILDFGCGLGFTVQLLRNHLGLNAVGVDLSADFEETSYLHRCELEKLLSKYPEGFFDAIYSVEVFEHLKDPNRIIALLRRLLKAGGKILVNTATREYISLFDHAQSYIDPAHRGHISIYSLESLKRMAGHIGYSVEFLGNRKYVIVLSPSGEQVPFPNPENLDRLKALGSWTPLLMLEYMRLVFLEKEFEEKCAWANQLSNEVEGLHSDRATLMEEQRRLAEERDRLLADQRRLAEERDRLLADQRRLAEERDRLLADQRRLAEEVKQLQQRIIPYRVSLMWHRFRGQR